MKKIKKISALLPALALLFTVLFAAFPAQAFAQETKSDSEITEITLRVANWEEYIDEGDWDEDEVIELESGDIIGENNVLDDFAQWYEEIYGVTVNVEYSTFGTNEDLYNMLTLGDVYDVICPSEYLFMKLMNEEALVPLSDEFFDTDNAYNYYSIGVSPYMKEIFDHSTINGEPWSKYAAGYMWGITGIVYNPEEITEEEASTWNLLIDPKYKRQITMKDNVRDSYFAALGALKSDLLTSEEFVNDPDYLQNLEDEMNDVSPETIAAAQEFLQKAKDNAYSFETDSGKADMVSGKVLANLQWSGDAVYSMDQADEDDFTLAFTVPKEVTNIYSDGWVMLKCGIEEKEEEAAAKQQAAEAFINYMSRPDIVIRNMYYTGYTSVIAAAEDGRIFEYADYNYGAEEEEEETEEYSIGYFFGADEDDEDFIITAPADQVYRQLYAAYPDSDAMSRASIMRFFDEEANANINRMWVNVRCFNIHNVPVWAWIAVTAVLIAGVSYLWYRRRKTY